MGPRPRRDGLTLPAPAAALVAAVAQGTLSVAGAMGVATRAAAEARGVPAAVLGPLGRAAPPSSERAFDAGGAWSPAALGALHRSLVPAPDRRRRGVHYTPPWLAEAVVDLALTDAWGSSRGEGHVLDPSCGGGAFLLAAARHLHAAGSSPSQVLATLHGIDLDPVAAATTVAALRLWAIDAGWAPPAGTDDVVADVDEEGGAEAPGLGPVVVVGDALDPSVGWRGPSGRPPAAVVGNPPFGGQLGRATARRDGARRAAAQGLGRPAGYADTAALFLHRAVGEVAPGGVVALLQPLSVLAARDTVAVRAGAEPWLRALWVGDGAEFDAAVHVCAPVVRRPRGGEVGEAPGTTSAPPSPAPSTLATGPGSAPPLPGDAGGVEGPDGPAVPDADPVEVRRGSGPTELVGEVPRSRLARRGTWSSLWGLAAGVPDVDLDGRPALGTWCTATAGFRDEFYALAPLVRDDPAPRPEQAPPAGELRVLTSGLVDPVGVSWGRRPARLAGRRLAAPIVHLDDVERSPEARLRALVALRRAPKVVLATQSRVLEAVVDDDGRYWPSVPLVSVALRPELDDPEHRWLVAAALTAPPVTAWALLVAGGTALDPRAVKLAARQVLHVPLPIDRDAWARGAQLLHEGVEADGAAPDLEVMAAVGAALTEAHGLTGPPARHLVAWWLERLVPARRRPG